MTIILKYISPTQISNSTSYFQHPSECLHEDIPQRCQTDHREFFFNKTNPLLGIPSSVSGIFAHPLAQDKSLKA